MKHIAKILLISCLGLSACRTAIDIPEDDARRDLTVIFAGSTAEGLAPQTMRISRTDFSHFRLKNNAQITLTVDGQEIPVTPATGEKSKGRYTLSYAFSPGQKVAIRVQEGGSIVTAQTEVPRLPQLIDFDVEEILVGEDDDYKHSELLWRVRLRDWAGESNYYRISATQQDIYEDGDTHEELSLAEPQVVELSGARDPIISLGRPRSEASSGFGIDEILQGKSFTNAYAAFPDVLFEGKEVEVKLLSPSRRNFDEYEYSTYLSSDEYKEVKIGDVIRKLRYKHQLYTLSLHATSEDLYQYYQTLGRFKASSGGSPFVSPIQLHSNITGGAGIFSVSSVVQRSKLKRSRD